MTRSDISHLTIKQLLSILDHGNPAEDVIPEQHWATEELQGRTGWKLGVPHTVLPLVYRPGPYGSDARK